MVSFENIETKNLAGKDIEKQWMLLTEAVRREILENPEARRLAAAYATKPVSESLPDDFLAGLSSNKRVAKLKERYSQTIGDFLKLPPVPEERIDPDIRHAPRLTERERSMVGQKYRFARDIKLLALGAEVLEQGENIKTGKYGEVILSSGTAISINTEDEQDKQKLLNPHLWEKRRQIKDRVYEITVGDSRYILKEKKTSRHLHTKRHGHIPGLTSLEEFKTAQHFQKSGTVEEGDVKVRWEKPVASVVFPDGFQFTVFEYRDGLMDERAAIVNLSNEIKAREEQFKDEFEKIKTMAVKFKNNSDVLAFEPIRTGQMPELTFADFAFIKALRIKEKARNLMKEAIIKNGYDNSDFDGYAFKVNIADGKFQLEIFGFDFEYFYKIDPERAQEILADYRQYMQERARDYGLPLLHSANFDRDRRAPKAGYLAMLELDGLLPTPKKGLKQKILGKFKL